ncbi:MAG: TetR/AcrR family transcriptional regulator [Clostridia bacterium]|nr:TetR/AcrR family transcriptional regulator [Clostridia bacterium]
MEDKRVLRTKRNIKQTLISLLDNEPFEKISVSEICRIGATSRITFYNYYGDKAALAEELLKDYTEEAIAHYHRLQIENNPENNVTLGYTNLLECILQTVLRHHDFSRHLDPQENPYLYNLTYNSLIQQVTSYISAHSAELTPAEKPETLAALFCSGLWCVISNGRKNGEDTAVTADRVRTLFQSMLSSSLFAAPASR